MTTAINREKVAGLIESVKLGTDIPTKLKHLQKLKDELCNADAELISEFLSPLLQLHTDSFSPIRKFFTQLIGDIGLKHVEFLPDIVPVLITILKDATPAVARQSVTCGIDLFRRTLVRIAIQGFFSSELDDSLKSSWVWALKLKDEIYSLAFQLGGDGRRLLALKFVATILLLYTPDPSGSPEPPIDQTSEEKNEEFNIAWLRGGHPVLNVGDLSNEASKSLGFLLDQLRSPTVKSLNHSTIIVLINSLSGIAMKRPAFYGRILPVLLGLDPSSSANKGVYTSGVHYPLKNAFLACLKCTHPSAAPWRDRLVGALREMKAGELAEEALAEVFQINGNVEIKNDSPPTLEEKPSLKPFDDMEIKVGRKRPTQDMNDLKVDDEMSGKRARPTPNDNDGLMHESSKDVDKLPSGEPTTSRSDIDNGPVQQLNAMFGALVAQGEKAVASLEILISSISGDLLAEVVMANMPHLPPDRPKQEDDEELQFEKGSNPTLGCRNAQFKQFASFLTDILSISNPSEQTYMVSDAQPSASIDHENTNMEEEFPGISKSDGDEMVPMDHEAEVVTVHTVVPVSLSEGVPPAIDDNLAVLSEVPNIGDLENEIPGLESSVQSDGFPETLAVSSIIPTDLEDASEGRIISLSRSELETIPSISTDKSEELSPKAASTDATSINSLGATSAGLPSQLVLPKMSAPVINLDEQQKDNIQKMAFKRIIEAYKLIALAGGSQVRLSLLAHLGIEFPLELDPWKILETHILTDYTNHEGHELTLRVLFRLFGEAESDKDFFSSTTATSVYEMFLLKVAETLRDSFPASDKSLSRLLGEVPYLPKSTLKLLECLCCPGNSDKDEKEVPSGDRVTQGLSAVWSLILLRPPIRDACLKIALQSAVHHLEEVRMKAIRLVANKLYPLSSITQNIEDFAREMLVSATSSDQTVEGVDAERCNSESQKESNSERPSNECSSGIAIAKDVPSDINQLNESKSLSSSSVIEMQRRMSLYFALCTKKHSLFRQVFVIYSSMSNAAKQAVHRQIPILVRTIGSSSQILEIISDPPSGSKNLLMQVLQTLTDGTVPSSELIVSIKRLYDTKMKDAQILLPILSFLPQHEVLLIFPHLVNLPLDQFQAALSRVIQGSSQSGPLLTPAEVLIAIHGIDPDRDGIPLKKVTDACNACFEQGHIFTQQVLAKVLNQLVEQIPLPLLFMRTVLQTIGAFPSLVEFIMEILSRLVSKQIWKYPKLWVGFLKCALLTKPQSFSVLLQLPPAQLENALNRTAALKAPLVAHANQPNIRSSLPRSVLVVLGISLDSHSSNQTPTAQPQSVEVCSSDKAAETEKSKESSTVS